MASMKKAAIGEVHWCGVEDGPLPAAIWFGAGSYYSLCVFNMLMESNDEVKQLNSPRCLSVNVKICQNFAVLLISVLA